jgi:inorganic pyrophosphatase
MATPVNELPAADPDSGRVNVVVDTPRGSRNKYKFDEKCGQWRLSKVLPQGMAFPYDFGGFGLAAEEGPGALDPRPVALQGEQELAGLDLGLVADGLVL